MAQRFNPKAICFPVTIAQFTTSLRATLGGPVKIATLLLAALLFPTATLLSQPPQKEVPAEVDSARSALKGALNDLQHAGAEWGGQRAKAMQHIQDAVNELNEAEKFRKEHHNIK